MRTGAIFARSGSRALKWLALMGVVFVLGAGQAAAQFTPWTIDEFTETVQTNRIQEGGKTTLTVTVEAANTPPPANVVVKVNRNAWNADFPTYQPVQDVAITVSSDLQPILQTADNGDYLLALNSQGRAAFEVTATAVHDSLDEPTEQFDFNVRFGSYTTSYSGAFVRATYPSPPKRNKIAIKATDGWEPWLGDMAADVPVMVQEGGQVEADVAVDDARRTTGSKNPTTMPGHTVPWSPFQPDYVVLRAYIERIAGAAEPTMNDVAFVMPSGFWSIPPRSGMNDVAGIEGLVGIGSTRSVLADLALKATYDGDVEGNEEFKLHIETGYYYYYADPASQPPGPNYRRFHATQTTTQANVVTIKDLAAPKVPVVSTVGPGLGAPGELRVVWNIPMTQRADGRPDAPKQYELRYRVAGTTNWTVAASLPVTPTELLLNFPGMRPGALYQVQVRAINAAGASGWSQVADGMSKAAADLKGQITRMEVTGNIQEKTIGGVKRIHVAEGELDLALEVEVQWDHLELTQLHNAGKTHAQVWVRIVTHTGSLPDWVSWIDEEQDVDFPDGSWRDGDIGSFVKIPLPKRPTTFPDSTRHHASSTGKLAIRVLEDQTEAENDAFVLRVGEPRSGEGSNDVDLNANSAVSLTTPAIVIEDNEQQTVTVMKGQSPGPTTVYENAGEVKFTIEAEPPMKDLSLNVRLDMVDLRGATVSSAEISLSDTSVTLDASNENKIDVTLHLPVSDGDRMDDEYKLNASVNLYSLSSGGFDTVLAGSHDIKVLDVHKLPPLMVSPKMASVAEGGEVELTLTLDRNPPETIAVDPETRLYTSEAVDVMLTMGAGTTAGRADYRLPATVEFEKHDGKAPWVQEMKVKVMAMEDDELDDGEMLVLDAMLAGKETKNGADKHSTPGVTELTISDDTMTLVWAKTQGEVESAIYAAKQAGMGADMMFTPGEMIDVMGSALFNAAPGVTLTYSVMSSDNQVASTSVSGGTVSVMAEAMGMADVTITAHASMQSSGVTIAEQMDPREASIMFKIEVGLEALSIELSGPEDMNLVEGPMGAMVTATANREVTEDTKVMLVRDRAMSSAGEEDYTAEAITIKAGAMMGSTMVMAVEDDMMENMENMPEELVLYGMTEGMAGEVTGEVKLYLWDAAVPALPVIAQLLLAAFLAIGGYRRYLRR